MAANEQTDTDRDDNIQQIQQIFRG